MRRYRKKPLLNEYTLTIGIFLLAAFIFFYLPKQLQSYGWFLGIEAYLIFAFFTFFALYLFLVNRRKEKKEEKLIEQIVQNNQEEYVKNFIRRFSDNQVSPKDWHFREHAFSWDRLRDFRKILSENGVSVSLHDFKDINLILRYYIQQDEEKITRNSLQLQVNKLSSLSGREFENLLVRLFTAMGYTVQHSGRVGDQGCDVILNSPDVRWVVQAKRYSTTVNNSAIQEAVAAKKLYDCSKAMVVTNSEFTDGALKLAKANEVELISYKQLTGLLLQYLKESWV